MSRWPSTAAAGSACSSARRCTSWWTSAAGSAAASTQFFAVPPFRAVDTRTGVGLSGAFSAGANRAVTLAGSGGLPSAATLRAVMAEATAVAPGGVGYLTVHPCLPAVPSLSMVRYATGANSANPVATPDDSTGRWCIAASAATHVLVDVSSYSPDGRGVRRARVLGRRRGTSGRR